MGLIVAIMGRAPRIAEGGDASWGAWAVRDWGDAAVLATDPAVTAARTDRVLVVTPRAGAEAARIAAATVGAVRPDLAVRVEVADASTEALLRVVETLPGDLPGPNAVAAALAAGLQDATWGAWLPSVARLERPAPSVGQHLRSWVARGAGFLAVDGDPGWVARLPMEQVDPARRLARTGGPSGSEPECHAFGELPEGAIAALFAMGLSRRPRRREPVVDPAGRWGSAQAVGFVLTRPRAAPGPASGDCPSCREPVWGACCPFCRVAPGSGHQHPSGAQHQPAAQRQEAVGP